MKKKTIYKTIVRIEILSEEPLTGNEDIIDINEQVIDGEWSGITKIGVSEPISGKRAVDETLNQGSDPAFFAMDNNGYELNI
jgi:hypothetical protein